MLGNEQDAQDVHQEAFLKAYRHLGNFRFECSFYTWLYRIVTNLCLDQLRRRKSRREDPSTIIDSKGDEMDLISNLSDDRAMANPARELDRKRMGQCINDALDKLTPRERMVFELKHYQGLKLRTIGEMLKHHRGDRKEHPLPRHPQAAPNLADCEEQGIDRNGERSTDNVERSKRARAAQTRTKQVF
jgi:RNA polymerase sigma factor (sigma-70 family)